METSSETGTTPNPSTSSPQASPAPTTPSPDDAPGSKAITDRSGLEWPTPFARFVPATSSSKMSPESEPRPVYAEMQESLLSEWSAPTWPRSAIGGRSTACELPTSLRLTGEIDGSVLPVLLPTPNAQESTPTDEFLGEVAEHLDPDDPLHLLPTPVGTDAFGTRNHTARRSDPDSKHQDGVTLTDAIWMAEGRTEDLLGNPLANVDESAEPTLLPTPTASERGERGQGSQSRGGGKELRAVRKLLPTPTANEKNPGAGGETRAALVHGEGRRNETGTDTMGRPNLGRTPRADSPPCAEEDATTTAEAGTASDPPESPSPAPATAMLLPTPETVNRKSKKAMTASTENGRRSGGGNSSPPGLEQIVELRAGRWPKDLPPYEELPPATREIVDSLMPLLPTPKITAERNSRRAMVENDQWASVALAQALEIAQGILPREFQTWEEVPGSLGASMRQPSDGGKEPSAGQLPIPLTNADD